MKKLDWLFRTLAVLLLLALLSACGAEPRNADPSDGNDSNTADDALPDIVYCAKWDRGGENPRYIVLDSSGLLEVYTGEADLSVDDFMSGGSEGLTCLFSERLPEEELQELLEEIDTFSQETAAVGEKVWTVTSWMNGNSYSSAANSVENKAYLELASRFLELSSQDFSDPEPLFVAKWYGGYYGTLPKYFLLDSNGLLEVYGDFRVIPLKSFLRLDGADFPCLFSETLSPEEFQKALQALEELPPFQEDDSYVDDAGYYSFLIDGEEYTCSSLSDKNKAYCDLLDYLVEVSIEDLTVTAFTS